MNINGYEITDGVLDLSGTCLTTIENKAFLSVRPLREVILPGSIENIGDWAFARCINLTTVRFEGAIRPGLFGKDVFTGCGRLTYIGFDGMDDAVSKLLALCTNKLYYDHLLRADDVGQKSWFEKWDIHLASKLKSDDAEAKMSAALCGEEDISYDGIGSVDGELPGETGDYVAAEEQKKSMLCYIRMSNDAFLSEETRALIEEHIRKNRFGAGSGSSFSAIFEEDEGNIDHLRIYLDVVKPDKHTLGEMIDAVPAKHVEARAYLIKTAGAGSTGLDDLLL
ncbi:MAG: leucine-rich repeat protein [Lachnospiraceae bacterium]|nr:leucine-rich repeat protein [Lachnospiraceae bacterium]